MPVKFTAKGNIEEIKALFNALNACKDCKSVKTEMLHKDKGLVTGLQTFLIEMRPATRYQERKEKPLSRDRQGYVYVMETPYDVEPPYIGIFKLGHGKDVIRRKRQHVKLPFAMKTVATIYSQDRYALERELLRTFATVRINGSEFVKLTAKNLSDIQAMG